MCVDVCVGGGGGGAVHTRVTHKHHRYLSRRPCYQSPPLRSPPSFLCGCWHTSTCTYIYIWICMCVYVCINVSSSFLALVRSVMLNSPPPILSSLAFFCSFVSVFVCVGCVSLSMSVRVRVCVCACNIVPRSFSFYPFSSLSLWCSARRFSCTPSSRARTFSRRAHFLPVHLKPSTLYKHIETLMEGGRDRCESAPRRDWQVVLASPHAPQPPFPLSSSRSPPPPSSRHRGEC